MSEDYVSFEVAKLLKEKGFDCNCDMYYTSTGFVEYTQLKFNHNELKSRYSKPTHQLVLKWLREVHNIFISIDIYSKDLEGNIRYCVNIYKYGSRMIIDTPIICNTYKESGDLAIKYCLENLI